MLNLATLNVEHISSRSTARLRDTAIARGHSITLLAATELSLAISSAGPTLRHHREELPAFDGVIPRLSAASDPFGISALKHLEARGAVALNVSEAVTVSHDKLHTLQRLSQYGLPVPPSAALHRPNDIPAALALVEGTQFIIKTVHGSQGVGVMFADSIAAASAIAETMLAYRLPILAQRFFREAQSSDLRAFVVGDRVVAAMRRNARPGEFRSNLHRGGSSARIDLPAALEELAVRATKALGLSVAGVDIIETEIGPLVLEVNSSPGLTGIEATTGVDIATPIIELLERRITAARS